MSLNSTKTKAKAVEALRVLLNAAQELTDAEKILRESPPPKPQETPGRPIVLSGSLE